VVKLFLGKKSFKNRQIALFRSKTYAPDMAHLAGTQFKNFFVQNTLKRLYSCAKAGARYGAPWRGGSRIEFLSNFGSKSSET
jgi:hypothetical protein